MDLGGERVESAAPESAITLEPAVYLAQRTWLDGVQPPGAVRADRGEPGFTQHPQVPGDGWLSDPEFTACLLSQLTRRPLARGQ